MQLVGDHAGGLGGTGRRTVSGGQGVFVAYVGEHAGARNTADPNGIRALGGQPAPQFGQAGKLGPWPGWAPRPPSGTAAGALWMVTS